MSITQEEARREIANLVAKYKNLTSATIKKYTEADTRRIFIIPLFRALGWDVSSRDEVTEEETVSRKRVDYAFRLRGIPKFFLEAKSLRADLNNPEYARQAINYAYHKGVTWAVLTDFEGVKVFNAEWKEPIVSRSLFFELSYDEYLSRFDWLWLLSRQAFEQNLLDRKALELFKKTKKTPVGQQLFSDLVSWRGLLDKYLSAYNKQYPGWLIDEAVQRILDRLIFIRTCEDRETESPILRPLLREWQNGAHKNLVQELKHIWRDFDQGYDSRLFLPHLADELESDPTPFAEIIEGLYATKDRSIEYDFNAIDADALGGIYEQYLEHLIKRAGKGIEVIPERGKRKTQGIYYTPKFVVRYIVENTLRPTLEGKPLSEARRIRILDLACGSGSFLVEALDYLERYWRQQKWLPQLSLETNVKQKDFFDYVTKVQFLTQNLYGVDLDTQAVEIAQLNLLLKALNQRQRLPDLVNNVRQGNSLISGTEEELKSYFGDRWREKKPFNWKREFADIMADGGFDVVIGNPPYVRIQTLPRDEADYYRERYKSAFGSFDIYILFLEQAIKLLRPSGRLGFITSGKFLKADYGKKIQQILRQECTVESIMDLSAQQVFAEATTYPVIIVLKKGAEEKPLRYTFIPKDIDLSKIAHPIDTGMLPITTTNQEATVKGIWPPVAFGDTLLAKLAQNALALGELSERIFVGLQTSADKVYILEKRSESSEGIIKVYSHSLQHEFELESALLKPLLSGKDIECYGYPIPIQLLLFPYKVVEGRAKLISPQKFASAHPRCWEYLLQNRETLENRERGKMRHEKWCAFGRTQNLALHDQRKMAIPRLVSRLAAIYDRDGTFYLDNVDVGGLILKEKGDTQYLYILGLLNSRLLNFYLHRISVPFRGGFYSANRQFLEPLPIRHIDSDNPTEKKMHDDLVALVGRMLELNKRLAPIRNTPCNDRDELLQEISHTDNEIDNLVYDLYGVSEEERKIVEGDAKASHQ